MYDSNILQNLHDAASDYFISCSVTEIKKNFLKYFGLIINCVANKRILMYIINSSNSWYCHGMLNLTGLLVNERLLPRAR